MLKLPIGERVEISVWVRPLPFGGWSAFFSCPRCQRRARFLFDVGAPYGMGELRCRCCGDLKYRSEGHFLVRLERKALKVTGRSFCLWEAPWDARFEAVA